MNEGKFGQESRSARPIQWNLLLDATELLYEKKSVSQDHFVRYLGISPNRSRELVNILHDMGLTKDSDNDLMADSSLNEFIKLWEQGDLRQISQFFRRTYPPYRRYLKFIERHSPFEVGEGLRGASRLEELNRYGLNRVSFDSLTRFAAPLGAVYLSGDKIHFAENTPDQELFERTMLEAHNRIKTPEGYSEIASLIDAVCRELEISTIDFEKYFKSYYDANYRKIATSRAILTRLKNRREIVILNPRGSPTRFDRRHLEDGINIYGFNIKAIRIIENER
jgi:hypothetical protein